MRTAHAWQSEEIVEDAGIVDSRRNTCARRKVEEGDARGGTTFHEHEDYVTKDGNGRDQHENGEGECAYRIGQFVFRLEDLSLKKYAPLRILPTLNLISMAAQRTPTLCTKSPMT